MNIFVKLFRLPIRLTTCLASAANPLSHWIIPGLLVILSLLKIAVYLTHGAIPVIASRAWAFMYSPIFAATGILILGNVLVSDLRKRKFGFALLVIGLGIMVFYRLGDIYHLQINYESAQELESFLKDNIHKPDLGIHRGCLCGISGTTVYSCGYSKPSFGK